MQGNHIVLVEPEIPQNTGNIARTCAATGSVLHLVGPLGFQIDDKRLKRAGLDYWHLLDIRYHDTIEEALHDAAGGSVFYLTTKAPRAYTEASFPPGSVLVFGKETAGLPEDLLRAHYQERAIRIPMIDDARSLNLSNAVAIVLYEALRQQGFGGLQPRGALREG